MTRKLHFIAVVFIGVAILVGCVAIFSPWWFTACLESKHILDVILPLYSNLSVYEVATIQEKYNGTVNCFDMSLIWMNFLAPYLNESSVILGMGEGEVASKVCFGLLLIGVMVLLLCAFVALLLSTLSKYTSPDKALPFTRVGVWSMVFGDLTILAALLAYTFTQVHFYDERLFLARVKPILLHIGNTAVNKFNFEPIEHHPYSLYYVDYLTNGPYFYFSYWLSWASFVSAVIGTVLSVCAFRNMKTVSNVDATAAELSALH